MPRTIEQLRVLASNPFYRLTKEERALLAAADAKQSDPTITVKKNKGIVDVKQTGTLDKHSPGIE